jgi:hypothetical protein
MTGILSDDDIDKIEKEMIIAKFRDAIKAFLKEYPADKEVKILMLKDIVTKEIYKRDVDV